MSVLFCSSLHLCMLEMQMQQPPGYRPRGGGISVMNEAERKSRGNYSEIVDCVISRMQMEHLKRRVREIFPGTGEEIKDLINLTYSMKGLSLITDFSDAQQVGKRLYMDENTAVSEEESKHINFAEYGEKALAEGGCRILPYGVLVVHGFEMQQIYNGRTFHEYLYDADKTVAVLEMKNKAGDRDYLYMPTDLSGVNMMKERLKILDLRECSVEDIHNVRLPESLVPKPGKLGCAEELAYFNEMCQNVCRFDEEEMKRLAMAAEFVGAKKYTDITYVAKCLNEFDITPSVHNDEEYGKFLVTQSGLFEVDELLLPHIDYAGFAADKRSGTLGESGYVPGGFVGVEKGIQEFLGYKGEFAERLEKDGDCYEKFCLYSPLKGMLTAGEEEDELCGDALVPRNFFSCFRNRI